MKNACNLLAFMATGRLVGDLLNYEFTGPETILWLIFRLPLSLFVNVKQKYTRPIAQKKKERNHDMTLCVSKSSYTG